MTSGAPASVLRAKAAACHPTEILLMTAQGTESENVTDSTSSVSRMADEEDTVEEPEHEYSSYALVQGLE